jgi:putative ABC transport system substrate-binding protein
MLRRDFLVLAGAAAAAWPLAALAQQSPGPVPRAPGGRPWLIGALVAFTQAQSDYELLGPFRKGLADLGYVEGRDFSIEARFTNGDATRVPAAAEELVALNPDLILGGSSNLSTALRPLTSRIPIISGIAVAELEAMVGKNLARPSGNITGIVAAGTNQLGLEKYCELALELVPGAKRVGILIWSLAPDGGASAREQVASAAAALKFTPVVVEVAQAPEIAAAFQSLAAARVDVVVVGNGSVFAADRSATVIAAAAVKLPTIYNQAGYPQSGGLISYGGDRRLQSARLATFADLIFRGAKPGDIPVEQSSTPIMSINLKTAKALGFTVPPTVLFRADEVIE